ncbi:hypothetical protein [Actinomyces ruminis]|uniref:hypothetical protein n=1 Tax=Actinomyces ruminis TaxID=1937003 RepID=UPI0030B7F8BD
MSTPGAPASSRSAAPAEQASTTRGVRTTRSGPAATGSADGVSPCVVGAIPTSQSPVASAAGRSHCAPVRVTTCPPAASIASRRASVRRNSPPSTVTSAAPPPRRRARRRSSSSPTAACKEPRRTVASRSPGATVSVARSAGSAV